MSTFRCLLFVFLLLASGRAHAVRHVALLVGANAGWSEDRPLRYATADARRIAATLQELGDFAREDVILLEQPTTERLLQELEAMAGRLSASTEQTLFVFYYSGHADHRFMHLRGEPLSFEELYRRVQALPATVKVGILDACQSGSILGIKGGRPTSGFQVTVQDELALHGTVFLASSGADELSQEAKTVSGSIFSHHLVSGLRGAADANGDHKVGIDEVYRYASSRTLLDTAITPAGMQRPGFRNELKGRGEVYLTRLKGGPVAFLRFKGQARHCFITDDAGGQVFAEVVSRPGQCVRVAVPVGTHELKCLAGSRYQVATFRAVKGALVDVGKLAFQEEPREPEGVLRRILGRWAPSSLL
jgi:uncharacterized caspase-like protein